MAELEIQRKKRPIWPWILGIALLLAVVWIGAEMIGDDDLEDTYATAPAAVQDDADAYGTQPAQTGYAPEDVQAFRAACGAAGSAPDEMDASHSQTAECLNRLAAALTASIQRDTVGDTTLRERMDVLRQNAEQLTQNPESTDHAVQVSRAMAETIQVLEQVADKRGAAGEGLRTHVTQMQEAAEEFGGNELMLEQKRAAGQFFEHAAMALEAMNRNQGGQS